MSSLAYIMQWGDHKSSIQKHLRLLFQEQKFVDVTLFCSTHSVRVHSVVVASNSSYFERVLLSQNGVNSVIVLKDMKFEVLKALVEFMYSGETTVLDEDVDALLYASKKFEVKGLCRMTRQDVMFFAEKNENRDLARDAAFAFPAEPAQAGTIQAVMDAPQKDANKVSKFDQECVRMENLYFEKTVFRRRGRPTKTRGNVSLPETALSDTEYAILKEAEESRRALEKLQKYVSHASNNQKHNTTPAICNINQNPLLKKLKIANGQPQKGGGGGGGMECESLCSSQQDLTEDEIAVRNLTNELNKQDRDHILESAGFPTDLPIFVDDGNGNYVNLDVEMAKMIAGQQLKYHLVQGIVMTNDDRGSQHSNPANVLVLENKLKATGLLALDNGYDKDEKKAAAAAGRGEGYDSGVADAPDVDFREIAFAASDELVPDISVDFAKSKMERKPFVVKEIIRLNQPKRKLASNMKNSVQVIEADPIAIDHS